MEKKLQPLKNKLLLFFFFVLSVGVFGQTLVNFPFTNTPAGNGLNPDVVHPSYDGVTLPVPSLTYGPSTVRYFNNNMLEFVSENDYLTMNINTTGKSGMILSLDGVADLRGFSLWADLIVEANVGPTGNFTPIGNFTLTETQQLYSINLLPNTIKSDLKIRLRFSNGWAGNDIVRIDNLKITAASPNIKVYNAGNAHIPHLSPASIAFTTDFGTRQTTAAALTRTFRVRNFNGPQNSSLIVNNITVTGANPGDFVVTPTSLTALSPTTNEETTSGNSQRTFTISFKPLSDGIRTAKINIYSNAAPSPYIFTVVGVGASCKLADSSTFAENSMSPNAHTLTANYTAASDLIGGTAKSNTLTTQLYPYQAATWFNSENNPTLYTSASTSWYVRNTTKTVEFGGENGLDISGQKNVAIEFSIAAFATANNRGVNSADQIKLLVLKPDNTWSEEMKLNGSNGSTPYYNYDFSGGEIFASDYDGNNSPVEETNRNTGFLGTTPLRYKKFVLKIPASANISNLKFRITANTGENNRMWLIDDVRVLTSNAVYKVWSKVGTVTRWRDANGNNASAPTLDEKAFIDANYKDSVNNPGFEACECEVNADRTLTIDQSKIVKLRGSLINNGIVNINSDGNLIQEEDEAVNIGNITAYRTMTPRRNLNEPYSPKEYSFYSSPVYGQNMKAIFGGSTANTAFALVLNEPGNNFVNANAAHYNIPGKGFAVKDPTVAFVGTQTTVPATFKGVPNNGVVKVPVTLTGTRGWNLVGNPYPSNLDLNTFFTDNNAVMEKDIRFWDKTVNATYSQYGGSYNGYSYAIYNAAMDVGNPAPGGDLGNNTGGGGTTSDIPGKYRYAKVGQGFLIRSKKATDSLIFKNNLRTPTQGDPFFGKNANEDDRNVYRLQLITPANLALTQTIIYVDEANNNFGVEDTKHPGLSSSDAFYSFADDEKLLINGRSSFHHTDVVNIGMKNYVQGLYKIRAINQSGVFSNGQPIYLKDKDLGIITDLTQGDYTFSNNAGEFTNRFEIVYKTESVLATAGTSKSEIEVYRDASDFVVRTSDQNLQMLELYDASGRLVFGMNATGREARFNSDHLTEGMYIIKAIMKDGLIMTKKIRK